MGCGASSLPAQAQKKYKDEGNSKSYRQKERSPTDNSAVSLALNAAGSVYAARPEEKKPTVSPRSYADSNRLEQSQTNRLEHTWPVSGGPVAKSPVHVRGASFRPKLDQDTSTSSTDVPEGPATPAWGGVSRGTMDAAALHGFPRPPPVDDARLRSHERFENTWSPTLASAVKNTYRDRSQSNTPRSARSGHSGHSLAGTPRDVPTAATKEGPAFPGTPSPAPVWP